MSRSSFRCSACRVGFTDTCENVDATDLKDDSYIYIRRHHGPDPAFLATHLASRVALMKRDETIQLGGRFASLHPCSALLAVRRLRLSLRLSLPSRQAQQDHGNNTCCCAGLISYLINTWPYRIQMRMARFEAISSRNHLAKQRCPRCPGQGG